jgi:hypothetical protein
METRRINMRLFRNLTLAVLALLAVAAAAHAQVTLGSQTGPAFSSNNLFFPNFNYPVATITGNGSAVINLGGVSTLSIRITGTYTASTTQLSLSNDSTNFTPAMLTNISNGQSGTTLSGTAAAVNGLYVMNAAGMTQLKITNSGTFTGTSQILKVVGSATPGVGSVAQPDPCQDKSAGKTSVAISISTATTTQVVAPVAGQRVYICNFFALEGASATVQLTQGTGATCGSSTSNITGNMTASATAGTAELELFLLAPTAVGNGVCIVTGAAVGVNGVMTVVQQ